METKVMKKRILGQGLTVSEVGLGCMGMSEFYGSYDDTTSLKVMHQAVDLGIDIFDTADMYGPYRNEELIGRFLKERGRESIKLATKFGIVRGASEPGRTIDNSPDYIRISCEASLKRLGVDYIDLYYVHRYNPEYPIEDVMNTLSEMVKAGKIGHIGLSEVSANTLRRAQKIHPVTALQSEYSLWSREVEIEVLPTCKELGVGFVAYSPIGRGFFSGTQKNLKSFDEDDSRLNLPRFHEANLEANQRIATAISILAKKIDCTPAQLAIAWVLSKDKSIVPIPGTKTLRYIRDNAEAANISISPNIMVQLDQIVYSNPPAGERYAPIGMTGLNT
jgi:aryl-alcohol dehydrogenase-like predicted oxidoreductase